MKHKVAIIICYFEGLPSLYEIWLRSCAYNRDFDFLIFTDQDIKSPFNNIRIIECTLDDIASLAQLKLPTTTISLAFPYKLCDFKPMYGYIFEDYLKKYSFWGVCDMDMIFGDLNRFINDSILDKYDKIYQLGHLTLYKNTREVNSRFMMDGYMDWKDVLATPIHCRFCERGMMKKYALAGLTAYTPFDYADISKIHRRYQLSHWLIPKEKQDVFHHQVFYYDEGHVYRAILLNGIITTEEFSYIHLQKRTISFENKAIDNHFYITQNTLIKKEPGEPGVDDIIRLNPYRGKLYELFECIKYEVKTRTILKRLITTIYMNASRKFTKHKPSHY